MDHTPRRLGLVAALLGPALLAGCVDTIDRLGMTRHLDTEIDRPRSLVERALGGCATKTEEGETSCVRQALIDAKVSVTALPGLLPGCRAGSQCHIDYTTRDRIGFVASTSDEFVVRWRVTIDLRHPSKAIGEVPITVVQIG